MSIKITYPRDWYDHQAHYCSACHKPARLKIEVRVDAVESSKDGKEYGPAQVLRLCREHLLTLDDVLSDDVEMVRSQERRSGGTHRRLVQVVREEVRHALGLS